MSRAAVVLLVLLPLACSRPTVEEHDEDGRLVSRIEVSRTDANGEVYDGDWEEFWPFGRLKETREYRGGQAHGTWIVYFLNGAEKERTEYRNGERHGDHRVWHPNGSLAVEGAYENGRRHGAWTERRSDGSVFRRGDFERGTGRLEFLAPDGEVLGSQAFVAGKPADGVFRDWHENGRRRAEGAYRGGRRVGNWAFFRDDGERASEGAYKEGERQGHWMFWSNGRTSEGKKWAEGEYVDGKPEGRWVFFEDSKLNSTGTHEGRYENGVAEGEWVEKNLAGEIVETWEVIDGVRLDEPIEREFAAPK